MLDPFELFPLRSEAAPAGTSHGVLCLHDWSNIETTFFYGETRAGANHNEFFFILTRAHVPPTPQPEILKRGQVHWHQATGSLQALLSLRGVGFSVGCAPPEPSTLKPGFGVGVPRGQQGAACLGAQTPDPLRGPSGASATPRNLALASSLL